MTISFLFQTLSFYVWELGLIFICVLVERSAEATKTTARGAGKSTANAWSDGTAADAGTNGSTSQPN